MKTKLLSFFIILCSSVAFAQQGIFYKAQYLKTLQNKTTKKIVLDAVSAQVLDTLYDVSDLDALIKELNANPFTKDMYVKKASGSGGSRTGFPLLSSGSITNLDVTNLAQGLSQFLIKRAKEELTVSFFNRFKEQYAKHPDFRILFPATASNLDNLLTYNYPQMLPALREGFLADLEGVILRLDDLLAQPRYQELLKDFPEITICIRSIKIVQQLESGASNAADVLNSFANLPEFRSATTSSTLMNVGCGLQFAAILSESLRKDKNDADPEGNIWISTKKLKELATDETLFRIYMGLIYEQVVNSDLKYYTNETPDVPIPFEEILASQADNLFTLQVKIADVTALTGKIDNFIDEIRIKKAAGTITNDDYYNYINESIVFLESGYDIVSIFNDMPTVDSYFAVLKKSNDIFKDTYKQEYTLLISDVVSLFELLNIQIKDKLEKDLKAGNAGQAQAESLDDKQVRDILSKHYDAGDLDEEKIAKTLKSANNPANINKLVAHYKLQQVFDFMDKVKPYALFMANMVEAKTPEEVENALESAALPVGSSSIKKSTSGIGNFAIQAYLGAYFADESNDNSAFNSKFGVLAPVGVAWTPGFLSWKKWGAVSVFGTLLDVGAIVDYDLTRETSATDEGVETVKKDYKVKLGQIFSPGGYLVYGFGANIPLSLGFGAQYGPGLSKIDDVNGAEVINPSWRWSIFLAVDIPLFTIRNTVKE